MPPSNDVRRSCFADMDKVCSSSTVNSWLFDTALRLIGARRFYDTERHVTGMTTERL
jgi:hypothetical protein